MKPDNYRSLCHLCFRPIRWFSTLLASCLLGTPQTHAKEHEILTRADGAPENEWKTLEHGASIGATYTKSFPAATARYVRLKINDSGALPKFSEFQIYE